MSADDERAAFWRAVHVTDDRVTELVGTVEARARGAREIFAVGNCGAPIMRRGG